MHLLEKLTIPEDLDSYVSDYKVNLFQVAYLSDEQVEMFQSDFKIVADYFVQKRKNNSYIPTKTEMKHVEAVLQLLSTMEHDNRFVEAVYRDDGKETKNMCDVLDVVEQRGELRGEQRGRAEGRAEGRTEAVTKIVTLLYGQGYMVKEIARMTGETEDAVKDILQLL